MLRQQFFPHWRSVMRSFVVFASLLGIGLLTGCPDRTISEVSPEQGRVEFKDIPVTVNRDIDILFVIDDSPSMADKQTNLKNNFPNFINVLNTIEGGLPNVHLGVVTSDLGASGADGMVAPAIPGSVGGCSSTGKNGALQTYTAGAAVTGKFISDVASATPGTRTKNYTGTLASAFSTIASAGAAGCGFEQHIEAAKRALQTTNTANAGFIRPTAYLAIIILADEDDCSMEHTTLLTSDTTQLGPLQSFRCTRYGIICDTGGTDTNAMNVIGPKANCHSNESSQYLTKIADYVTFFKSLKADPTNVIVAGIVGVPTPFEVELRAPNGSTTQIPALAHSCTYTDSSNQPEVADPAIRIKQLLDSFPNRSTFSTICQQDLSTGLVLIAQLLKSVLGSPCIDGTLATPYDCSVSDVSNYGAANQVETVLPACNGTTPAAATNKPCWAIETDAANCTANSHLTLKVERNTAADQNTHVVSYCVTEAINAGSGSN